MTGTGAKAECGPWGLNLDVAGMAERLQEFATMAVGGQPGSGSKRFEPGGWGPHGPPWSHWPHGPKGPFAAFFGSEGGPPWGRGPKAKRGDVRTAILTLLAEEPRNGYQIIQEIHERSGGAWKPSPGAVYPALQQLADEGLVRAEESEGRRTFHLTDAGQRQAEERAEEEQAPWETMAPHVGSGVSDLFRLATQCSAALVQVVKTGTEGNVNQARDVLAQTRRNLYRILADDLDAEGPDDTDRG